jgi:hypothetical protein
VIRSYVANKASTVEIGRPLEPGVWAGRISHYRGLAPQDKQLRRRECHRLRVSRRFASPSRPGQPHPQHRWG